MPPRRCQPHVTEALVIYNGDLSCWKFISHCGCRRSGVLMDQEEMNFIIPHYCLVGVS